jgi:hypothetical protein
MKSSIFLIIVASILLFSCSAKYRAFKNHYAFKSKTGEPDYTDMNYWAAHPWKHDPSDSIPEPLRNEYRDSVVDVFFLHPTTYTRKLKMKTSNARIDHSLINAKTDYSTILYQSSVFNQQSRVFAPRYRQAHIKMFFTKNKEKADAAFAIAYKDLKTAFEYYLQHWNNRRPIIIASHSQGSLLAEKLLKEFFEDKSLKDQLVVAYIAGWPVPKDYFSSLKMCADSLQTGCICSWRTLRNEFVPRFLKNEKGNSFVTNPLTWTIGYEYVPRQLNNGSVLSKFNKIYKHTTDARISNGLLYVRRPRFPWSFLYIKRNYHIGDINLFYMNIRENVRQRIKIYAKNNQLR